MPGRFSIWRCYGIKVDICIYICAGYVRHWLSFYVYNIRR